MKFIFVPLQESTNFTVTLMDLMEFTTAKFGKRNCVNRFQVEPELSGFNTSLVALIDSLIDSNY